MITLRHIEIFHAVYQTGSLSGAARLLGVSQPSVSKVLRHAESQLGLALFRVVKGRLVATDEAHRLFEEAAAVQERVATLYEAARNLRRADHGRLRVATIHSLGLRIVPRAIAVFAARYPQVSFDVRTFHTEGLAETLHSRTCDLSIGYDIARHPRLANVVLGSGELVVLFRRQDLPDPPPRIAVETLHHLRMVELINDGTIGGLLAWRMAHREDDRATIAAKTYFVAAALVEQGMGFAVMDEFTARACLTPAMDLRPLDDPMRFDVVASHLEDQPLSTVSRQFLDSVRKVLAEPRA
ncbi:LysR family transcriptional regulator [Sphingomonas sp.]|uniref:LysR family transcriptional regulator n=1 Tax=Sphingomonas sp. TaxID=28214 RepID=UPI002DD6B856|nr:LysR family transcriptional regulator [Sphingomonas sp.]